MARNVLILGAGFSFDAGIPVLSDFMDHMYELSQGGRGRKTAHISVEAKANIERAMEIRNKLRGFHQHARFNQNNIEDVLSILSMSSLQSKDSNDDLSIFAKAIADTIEAYCKVIHPGPTWSDGNPAVDFKTPDPYLAFWHGYFHLAARGLELPVIISFNYDLVLERSLCHWVTGPYQNDAFQHDQGMLSIDYSITQIGSLLLRPGQNGSGVGHRSRSLVLECENRASRMPIEILKLHGSCNFDKGWGREDETWDFASDFARCCNNPLIVPPVSNKTNSGVPKSVWARALDVLNTAESLVFVGYSMPATDLNMQFFLKAGLGPNEKLRRVTVFDPKLWSEPDLESEMRCRFKSCFADNLFEKIEFNAGRRYFDEGVDNERMPRGSTKLFVHMLGSEPNSLFH